MQNTQFGGTPNCQSGNTTSTASADLRTPSSLPASMLYHPSPCSAQPMPLSPRAGHPEYLTPLSALLQAAFATSGTSMKKGFDPEYVVEPRKRVRPSPSKKARVNDPKPPTQNTEPSTACNTDEAWEEEPFLVKATSAVFKNMAEVSRSAISSLRPVVIAEDVQDLLDRARATKQWINREAMEEFVNAIELIIAREGPRLQQALDSLMSVSLEVQVARDLLALQDSFEENGPLASVIHAATLLQRESIDSRSAEPTQARAE